MSPKTQSEIDAIMAASVDEMRFLETLPSFVIELDSQTTIMLVGQLQLAARHPENLGRGGKCAVEVARGLQSLFEGCPSLHALMEMGWNPDFDQTLAETKEHLKDKIKEALTL